MERAAVTVAWMVAVRVAKVATLASAASVAAAVAPREAKPLANVVTTVHTTARAAAESCAKETGRCSVMEGDAAAVVATVALAVVLAAATVAAVLVIIVGWEAAGAMETVGNLGELPSLIETVETLVVVAEERVASAASWHPCDPGACW